KHPAGHMRFRNGVGFYDASPPLAGQLREVFGCYGNFLVGGFAFALDHVRRGLELGLRTLACTAAVICDLTGDVVCWQPGKTRVLRPSEPVGQMAVSAGIEVGLAAMRDDVGHRRMRGMMPVRRIEEVLRLRDGKDSLAAGYVAKAGVRLGRR